MPTYIRGQDDGQHGETLTVCQGSDGTKTTEWAHRAAGGRGRGPHGEEVPTVVDAVVAGSAIFGASDYKKVIDAMRAVLPHTQTATSRLVTAPPKRPRDRGGPGRPPAGLPDTRIQNPHDSNRS